MSQISEADGNRNLASNIIDDFTELSNRISTLNMQSLPYSILSQLTSAQQEIDRLIGRIRQLNIYSSRTRSILDNILLQYQDIENTVTLINNDLFREEKIREEKRQEVRDVLNTVTDDDLWISRNTRREQNARRREEREAKAEIEARVDRTGNRGGIPNPGIINILDGQLVHEGEDISWFESLRDRRGRLPVTAFPTPRLPDPFISREFSGGNIYQGFYSPNQYSFT